MRMAQAALGALPPSLRSCTQGPAKRSNVVLGRPGRQGRRRHRRCRMGAPEVREGEGLRHPGVQLHQHQHRERRAGGRQGAGQARDDPVLGGRLRLLRGQEPAEREGRSPDLHPRRCCGCPLRPPSRASVRHAGLRALRPLREEAAAVVRRHAGGRRGLLQGARRAALLLAHAGPLGGARRGEHRHLRQVLHPHGTDETHPGDGDRHHRRRGGRRGQQRREQGEALLHARGHAAGLGHLEPYL
mmetsp:Transcript_92457/g.299149  ORF Transcript_92457/g.299149 Transcript_92457/m.299149 type:complete len:243 (-) Transcript_92457:227-955(-)